MKILSKYFIVIVFMLSAFLKLLAFSATVDLFVNLLGFSYAISKIFLALLILIELIVAYLVVADYLKFNIVYLLILGLITAFLFANIFFAVNGYDNCGCFGVEMVSAPALSIAKNILLLSALIYLRKNQYKINKNLVLSK